MNKVSAVIITLNEELNLPLSLPRLSWCDEIIVVDSGSTDDTLDICQSYNCKIYHKEFKGYGEQKQYAVSLAKNKWVVCLDADEVLSERLVNELKIEMQDPTADGYYMPMIFVFMGKEFRYGKEDRRYFLRLYNKEKGGFNNHTVHEKIELAGRSKKLLHPIYHYSYRNFSQCFDKTNRYSSYGAEIAYKKGQKKSLLSIVLAVPINFLKYYLIERNFLNGLNGFYWSVINAFYHFSKYIKLRELYQVNPVSQIRSGEMQDNIITTKILSENLPARAPLEEA
jgi:glycosyltransferase involved in cell wall biosynthesis